MPSASHAVPAGFGAPTHAPAEQVGATWQFSVVVHAMPSGRGVQLEVQQPPVRLPSSHASFASRLPLPHRLAVNVPGEPSTVAVPLRTLPSPDGAPAKTM